MGERAINREMATAEDIELMARLTEEALKAGAVGFTTSRTDQHKTLAGDLVPGRYAEHEELIAIGKAMGRAGVGTFGFLSDFDDEKAEWSWIRQVAKESGRPVWFLLTDRSYDPQRYKRLMDGVRACRADNLPLYAQVAGRPVGLTLGLNTSLNPFGLREGYAELAQLPPAEMLAKLRTPEVRRLILSQEASPRLLDVLPPLSRQIATRWDRMYPLGDTPDYEPAPERSIEALAERRGRDAAGILLRLSDRRREPHGLLPRHQLRARRSRGRARDDRGSAHHPRPVRRRRALRRDLRCLAQHLDAAALGARPHARPAPRPGVRGQAA